MPDIHVLPINDLRDHEETRVCWCAPRCVSWPAWQGDVVVIHHSADCREFVEEHGLQ